MFANSANAGKTFTITFRAKASEAGIMDFAFNKAGSFNTYAYGGTTYKTQYSLTTEYQTYSYTFVALEDMFTTNASSAIQLAFRLYNGYAVNGAYKAAQVYIDDIQFMLTIRQQARPRFIRRISHIISLLFQALMRHI